MSLSDVNCDQAYRSVKQRERLEVLQQQYADVLSEDEQSPVRADDVSPRIDLVPSGRRFNLAARRVPRHLQKEVEDEEDSILRKHLIEPSESDLSSAPVLVRKKDGCVRFCVDLRKLNEMTFRDNYPLGRIDDALDSLGPGFRYFTTLDLAMG